MKNKIKIAICEDLIEEQNNLIDILSASTIDNHVNVFNCGEDFLNVYKKGMFDLIFMDIYMKQLTGVEVVTKIREQDDSVLIAFTTTSLDHTLEGYRLDVAKYLEKPVRSEPINALLRLAKLKSEDRPKISLSNSTQTRSIYLDEIIFIEQKGVNCYVHILEEEPFVTKSKLTDLIAQLDTNIFNQCHKSYIVNFIHIHSIDKELLVFEMNNGMNVHIRRDSFWKTKHAYEDYLFRGLRGNSCEKI